METDASGIGLGAVLTQVTPGGAHRPFAFASLMLQAHEQNYGSTELEPLGREAFQTIPIWTYVPCLHRS